jgi:hypothetical protein
MSNNNSHASQPGIMFGPNDSGKTYISLYSHRGTRPQKHRWDPSVPPQREYGLFCTSDQGGWQDLSGHYWGFGNLEGTEVIGTQGERLCKFPRTSNEHDPWHGYPVSPLIEGDTDAPPDALVESWLNTQTISRTFARRIQRRKV